VRRWWEICLIGAWLLALPVRAATNTWEGGNNDQWNASGSWSLNRPPTATDDVILDNPRNIRLTTGPNAVAGTLTIRNVGRNFRLNANGGRTLTVFGTVSVDNANNAALALPFTTASGGSTAPNVSKSGAGTLTFPEASTIAGNLSLSAGTLTAQSTLSVGGALTATGGTLNAQSTLSAGGISIGGATVTSAGTVTVSAGAVTVSSGSLTAQSTLSAGTIGVPGGTLTAQGNVTATGAVTISSGGTLAFQTTANLSAASFSLDAASTLSLNFSSTTVVTHLTVSGNAVVGGTVSLTGSTPSVANSPYHLVTATGGTIDFTGITLGTVPTGLTFGFRILGNVLVMDVRQNPIAIDAVTSITGTCGAGTISWQHTVGATTNDRLLVVGVSTGSNTGSALPTSVTFDSQTTTARGGDNAGTTQVQIYTLTAPARGTHTITLTFPGGSSCFVVAGAVSYTGVSQSAPIGAVTSNTETGNTPLLATVTVPNLQLHDKVFGVLSSNTATSATPVQTNVTARWSALNGTEYGTAETLAYSGPAGGSTTLSYNMGPPTSQFWSMAAVPIHAANPNAAAPGAPELRWSGGRAVVSWRLGPASDVVGFRVWREAGGRRELLTPGLVAGPVLTSRATLMAGSEPGWVDSRPVSGATYLIESLHTDGSTRWTSATSASGKAPVLSAELLGSSPPAVLPEQGTLRVEPADAPPVAARPGSRAFQWRLAAGSAVKIAVASSGVVRVPAESLFAAGLPVGTRASSIQMFREARPIARTVLAADNRTLQLGDAVEFYGYGMDSRYSGTAVYWLTSGDGMGEEIRAAPGTVQDAGSASFLAAAEFRERLTWFGAARNGDAEKFFGPAIYSQARQRTFTLEAVDLASAGARLELSVQGLTEISHAVNVILNGLPLGTLSFEGAIPASISFPLPPGSLVPGDNIVGLVAPAPGDISLEQVVRLVYPRPTFRGTGALDFTLEGGMATRLEGFDAARTQVLDVTDPDAPVRLRTGDASGAAAILAVGAGTRHLVAYLDTDVAAPASVLPNRPSSWNAADGAELVILGSSGLFDAVMPLVERRKAEGLSVALVDIEDVQDEFASGEKSVDAVRGFLQHALKAWVMPPRYLLLLGAATYDPRDYLALGGDLVPSAVVQTDALEAVSDSWFVGVPGAESMSVGRLPVHTAAEAAAVVAKILARREADARSPVLLASDALGTSDFPEMTADLRTILPDAPATVIVRGTDPDDVLHQRFLDAALTGPALVNYTGHASQLFWNGNLHTVADVEPLSHGGTSLWVHMTCLTGFFQDPRRQSLAVATLLSSAGGAWGAWASTSMTYPTDHPALNRALVRALLVEGRTLGEATREALSGVSDPDLANTFVLLGDPSARAVTRSTAPLATAPRSSALGCTTAPETTSTLVVLLAVGVWLAGFTPARARARSLPRR